MKGLIDHRRAGFTLIEVLVVMVIIGLLAAAVRLKLWEPLQGATQEDVAARLETLDHLSRLHATHADGPVSIVFKIGQGKAYRQEGREKPAITQQVQLPTGWTMASFWSAGRSVGSGEQTINCSPDGLSATYALEVTGPGGQQQWLVFAGLSGQVTRISDEQQAQKLLAALPPAGPDAR